MAVAVRRGHLARTAALGLVLAVLAGAPAWANTVNGAPAPAYTIKLGATVGTYDVAVDTDDVGGPGSVGIAPVITPTSRVDSAAIEITNAGLSTVTVNSGRLVGAHNTYAGIWINRGESVEAPYTGVVPATATIVNNGMIQGSQFGIDISGLCGANCTSAQMKSVAISGTGRVFGATAMNLRGDTVSVNGHSLIFGWNTGLDIVGTAVTVGTTTRLGEVIAGSGSAIRIQANTIDLAVGKVTSGIVNGAAISLMSASEGTTTANLWGAVTALGDGLSITRDVAVPFTPVNRVTVNAGASITANRTGLYVAMPSPQLDIRNDGAIVAGGNAIWMTGPAGAGSSSLFSYNGNGSIVAGGTGIRALANTQMTVGSWFAVSPGPRPSETAWLPIGTINAGAYGIQLDQRSDLASAAFVRLSPSWISAGIGIYSDRLFADMVVELAGGISGNTTAIFLNNFRGQFSLQGRGTAAIGGGLDALNIAHDPTYVVPASQANTSRVTINRVASFVAVSGTGIRVLGSVNVTMTDIGWISASQTGIDVAGSPNGPWVSVTLQNIGPIWAANGDAVRVTGTGNPLTLSATDIGNLSAGANGFFVSGPFNASFQGVSSITAGLRGIDVFNALGVSIGGSKPLGAVTGGIDGIRVIGGTNRPEFGLLSGANITGTTGWGVTVTNALTSSVFLNAGTISGGTGGMSLSSSNSLSITSGFLARIEGPTGLQVTLLPSTSNAIGTVSNSGVIRSTNASGSGADIAIASNGQIAITNFGTITGRVTHNAQLGAASSSLGFYNKAGGTWNPGTGTSSFAGAADALGNEGTINLAAGTTRFEGLELFGNNPGGVISFLGSTAATDELVVGGWLQLQGGGRLRVNFNADAALGALDRGTSGNADSITSTLLSATGVTTIDIVATGGSNGAGAPVPLTGSVVLVSTGLALPAPAPGATLTPAANYVFGTGNPSTAARTFALVGDGLGGVFLQWVPVTSGGTIGGFSGGALGAADSAGGSVGGSLGFLQASLAGASQAAVQVADMTSFGAAFGAAFGGTGAAGAGCGSANGASFSVRTGEWAGTGRRSASGASAQGRDLAFSPGAGANSCGRVSVGAFQFGGTATVGLQAQRGTDAARGTMQGAGGYVRADSGTGFFAQLTGAAGSQRAQVRNGIFGTEATVDTTLGLVDITAGYAKPISDSLAIETRVSATRLNSAANPFRDNLGYEVTRLDTRADSLTATAGLIARTGSGGQGFVRAGIRTTDARQDGLAYGIRTLSQDSGTGRVLEAGWNQPLGEAASLELALSSDSGGPLERQEVRVAYQLSW